MRGRMATRGKGGGEPGAVAIGHRAQVRCQRIELVVVRNEAGRVFLCGSLDKQNLLVKK